MLNIKNLGASINNKEILKGLNINIKPGELHAIMGPNGSGKSTLANVLSGKEGYKVSGELKYQGKSMAWTLILSAFWILGAVMVWLAFTRFCNLAPWPENQT